MFLILFYHYKPLFRYQIAKDLEEEILRLSYARKYDEAFEKAADAQSQLDALDKAVYVV